MSGEATSGHASSGVKQKKVASQLLLWHQGGRTGHVVTWRRPSARTQAAARAAVVSPAEFGSPYPGWPCADGARMKLQWWRCAKCTRPLPSRILGAGVRGSSGPSRRKSRVEPSLGRIRPNPENLGISFRDRSPESSRAGTSGVRSTSWTSSELAGGERTRERRRVAPNASLNPDGASHELLTSCAARCGMEWHGSRFLHSF